jgi:hypothetical protein
VGVIGIPAARTAAEPPLRSSDSIKLANQAVLAGGDAAVAKLEAQ